MDSDGLEGFDYARPLQVALSQLNGLTYDHPMEDEEEQSRVTRKYMKPAELCALADEEDPDETPITALQIIDEITDVLTDYSKTCTVLMKRGLLKKRQECKKCFRMMTLRRRKDAYEWRCRTKDKKGDCSSCSIKTGSWFEYTKLSFKMIFNFLIMHCKMCSPAFISEQLKLSYHSTNEIRRFLYQLTDRIVAKYPKIGENQKEVYMELIHIKPKVSVAAPVIIAAGKEAGSNRCFAVVLRDSSPATVNDIKRNYVAYGAPITMIQTNGPTDPSAIYMNEEQLFPHQKDRFFSNLRKDPPDNSLANGLIQSFLNDQVARKAEGTHLLESCIDELRGFVSRH
ncbi:hypothetical protein CAEBREN_05787 [Caenorhabditis brenneri]|uniref:Uncharacterized protein n=1 Tax=Caenorhabditis brenneri TaxID=135651 RepID=G0PDM4_CAEBE|nr:hypothetical protein CAEBREN_05787 [Caenorhabditis brenneri]